MLDFSKWINSARDLGYSALSQVSEVLGAGAGFVKAAVGGAWLFGSTETSSSYDHEQIDEKHYFLIPDRRSEIGYSLYVMRCLPEGVPPINDLPKRRLFHLPNQHSLPTVEHILLNDARKAAESEPVPKGSLGNRLNEIADQIDRLDSNLFNGVLLIGGLVALANPVAGAAVAMKVLLPSVGLLLSKYGIKYVGDTTNSLELSRRIKSAEKDIMKQFRDSGTDSLVNPVLLQLDRALETSQSEYEPIVHFNSAEIDFGKQDRERLLKLTCQAISNTYEELIGDRSKWKQTQLGPEDIEFLKMLRDQATKPD